MVTSTPRPSYSWVSIWVTPLRALHTGAFSRKMSRFTTFFSQSLHCAFKNRTYLLGQGHTQTLEILPKGGLKDCLSHPTRAPYSGLDHTDAFSAMEDKMAECGLTWLTMKWLTLNSSDSCCIGRSFSNEPSLYATTLSSWFTGWLSSFKAAPHTCTT